MRDDFACHVKKAIRELLDEKLFYTRFDFIILYTAVIGTEPTDKDIRLLFEDNRDLKVGTIINFLVKTLESLWDPELKVVELFKTVDSNGKYFIDKTDLLGAWKKINSKLSLSTLIDCFDDLAVDGTIDYLNFKTIYLANGLD